jgi:hypothetical protein
MNRPTSRTIEPEKAHKSPPAADSPRGPRAARRYETLSEPLITHRQFHRRMRLHLAAAVAVVLGGLSIGVAGYHTIAGMSWVDSVLNASMILSGMGPVGELKSDAAKLFAAGYALFSGLMFVVTTGILVTPIAHRLLHKMHADTPG